jgi:hypothetical protein
MNPVLRTILNVGALVAVTGSLYVGLSYLGSAVQSHFRNAHLRPETRLNQMIPNAREIRQALATAIPPPEPLPRVAQQPAKTDADESPVTTPPVKKRHLSRAARYAYASGPSSHVAYEPIDRHRPY